MSPELLVCPGCRVVGDGRIELRTLEREGDALACACGRTYPIVDGVPLVLPDPAAYLGGEIAAVIERDLPPETVAQLVLAGPDDAAYARLVEHLSIYLDAHWGDRAAPPPDGPAEAFGAGALAAKIAERRTRPVARAVELGCSAGRFVAELAAGAAHVVGVDLQFGALRRARRLLAGERLGYARRVTGRHYAAAHAAAGDRALAAERTTLVCGDALDPPLAPGMYDRVVALNLLDSVSQPRQLLAVLDALCAPGGELILASPYSWQAGITPDAERLGDADPAAALRAHLAAAGFLLEDEAELPWTLRRDARSAATYCVHYIRARKES